VSLGDTGVQYLMEIVVKQSPLCFLSKTSEEGT
jgi:hypothetical protein